MTARLDHVTWGISSLGAPELSLREFCDLARTFKLDFLELRVVKGTIALPDYFRDHPEDREVHSCSILGLSTDLRLIAAKDEEIAAFMRYVDLAKTWNVRYLRIFGGGLWGDPISSEHLAHAVKTVERCRELMAAQGSSCEMILETHSGFSSAKTCRSLNENLSEPLSILWDSHHTWKLAGESLEESWAEIGPWVRHVHYKDSVSDPKAKGGYRYVVPGAGEFPTADLLQLLARVGYRGGISLEWEKLWHPEIADFSEALAGFKRACFGKLAIAEE